jgi:hypothetical protein
MKGQEHFCLFNALVVYLIVNQEPLSCTEKLFINPGAELCSASQSFNQQICEIAKRFAHVVRIFCRLLTSTGFGKGVALLQHLPPLVLLCSR